MKDLLTVNGPDHLINAVSFATLRSNDHLRQIVSQKAIPHRKYLEIDLSAMPHGPSKSKDFWPVLRYFVPKKHSWKERSTFFSFVPQFIGVAPDLVSFCYIIGLPSDPANNLKAGPGARALV